VAAFALLELGDRLRLPQIVPTLVCVTLGVAAVAGSIVISG
jgi:hypothetical protein